MRIRAVVLLLAFGLPCVVAVADIPTNLPTSARTHSMRLSLFNTSGQRRQARVNGGVVELPFAKRVDIDVRVGAVVRVVSDTNRAVDQPMLIAAGDDARLILVR